MYPATATPITVTTTTQALNAGMRVPRSGPREDFSATISLDGSEMTVADARVIGLVEVVVAGSTAES
jgi:hypothetical protein